MCAKEFHSNRMRLSIQDKVRALPYFREGEIIEIGCGAGDFLHILKERFPTSAVVGIDKDKDLLDLAKRRYRNIEFILQDITRWTIDDELKGSFDTVILSSTFHEIEYDKATSVLVKTHELLRLNGRLIFRDGLKQSHQNARVRLKTQYAQRKFERFICEYRNRNISYTKMNDTDGRYVIVLSMYDLHDILCKYWYEGELWEYDMDESFGNSSESEYIFLIRQAGFIIEHVESYVAEYQKKHWIKDFEMLDGLAFPNSHVLIVAEKTARLGEATHNHIKNSSKGDFNGNS